MTQLTALVRDFKSYKVDPAAKNMGLLNFISSKELSQAHKPIKAGLWKGDWTRASDCKLLFTTYESGCFELSEEKVN